MKSEGRPGAVAMSLVAPALLLVACGEPQPMETTVEARPTTNAASCDHLRGAPEQFGFCRMSVASNIDNNESAEVVCEGTRDWRRRCRQAWAVSRAERRPDVETSTLLAACVGIPDCLFEIIDHRRSDDLFEQLERCEQYAGPFAGDCAVHALDRWIHGSPSLSEINLLNSNRVFPVQAGQYIAAASVCLQLGDCKLAVEEGQAACERRLAELRQRPTACERLR